MDLSRISDTNSEAVVIATLVYHPEYIMHTEYLKPGYFYNVENGCIYWAISELYKSGIDTIDALNISTMLSSNKAVKRKIEQSNMSNIQEFIDLCGLAARDSLEEYKLAVANVVTTSYKRDMIKTAEKIERLCNNEELTLASVNKKINSNIDEITEKYLVTDEIVTMSEEIDDIWNEIQDDWNGTGVVGMPTIIPELNNYITHRPGELFLVAGRMGMGKSAYMMNEALNMLKNGVPVLYIDTEMSKKQFVLRSAASLTGIPVRKIESGDLTSEEKSEVADIIKWIKDDTILVHKYMTEPNMDEVYALCKILKHKIDLGFIVYDYIKADKDDSTTNYNYLGQITDFLKNKIAGELNIPVLAGAQLNREMAVADSDKIERYISSSIYWLPKSSEEINDNGVDCGNFKIVVGKNRNGSRMIDGDWIDVVFDGGRMRIKQAERQHAPMNPFT